MTRTARLALMIGFMLAVAGCSAEHYYRKGQEALARQQFDKAIDNFSKAFGKEPENPQYREALDSARQRASAHALSEATRLAQSNDLVGAQTQAERALRYDPNNAQATQLLADVRQRAANADAKRRQALDMAGAGQYDQAIELIGQALTEHRTLPGGQQDANRIRQMAAAALVGQARAALAANQWDQAEQLAQRALGYWPADSAARQIAQDVANRRQAEELVRQARAALDNRQFEAAVALLEQARRLHPDRPDLPALLAAARQGRCDEHLAEGRRLMAAGDFLAAIRQFEMSRAILPGYGNVDALIAEAQSQIVAQRRQAADQAAADQMWGNALVQYLMVDLIAPGSVPPASIDQCVRAIAGRLEYRVGVVVAPARPQAGLRNAPATIEPAVIRHLSAVRPDPVVILTGPQTSRALADQALSPVALVGPGGPAEVVRLRGALAGLVVVRLDDLSVVTTQTQSLGTTRFQSGVRRVPNPAHATALAERDAAVARVRDLAAELDRLERAERALLATPPSPVRDRQLRDVRAEIRRITDALNAARNAQIAADRRLADTPRFVDEPVFTDVTFPIIVHTKTARLTATVQLLDAPLGRSLFSQSVTSEASATDNYVQVDPARHIPGDPLDLPTDDALAQQAVMLATSAIEGVAEAAVYRWMDRYPAMAQDALRSRQVVPAIEATADRLFVQPYSNPATEQAFSSLLDMLGRDAETARLRHLFVTRLGLLRPPLRLPIAAEERDGAVWVTRLAGAPVPPGMAIPCQLAAVQGRPVRTVAAMDWTVNGLRPGDRVAVDLSDRGRVTRVMLPVEPAR